MREVLERKRTQCLMQIIETGTVRGAADALGLDPSVVSRAVARLEKDTGLALLERRGRGVVPTDAGRLLALFARRQQDLNDTFVAEVNALKDARRGHVELVLGEGFVDLLLQPLLQGFASRHPDVTCDVAVAGTDEAVRRILDDQAHLGFVFQPPDDARLRSHHSRVSPFRAHVRKDHPLARRLEPLTLADLVPHQGAALADSFGVRKHIEAAQVDEQVTLKPILVTNSFKVLWSFAAMGLGYVLTPRSVPLEGPRFSEIVSLPLANPLLNNCRSHLVTRDGRPLPPAPERMLGHALELFRRI